jgi:DNA mismatch endonuclease (patch repair protein)
VADTLTKVLRSERMSLIKGSNTKPELAVRRGLHKLGFRFRLHARTLPGKPDIVLPKYHAVIFVHGCFWHAHRCQQGRVPQTNSAFWKEKFLNNRRRDVRVARALRKDGWRVFKIWECHLRTPALREKSIAKVARLLRATQQ